MVKNHWNTLKVCLIGQTTKQPLSNPENLKNINNFEGWGLNLVTQKKECSPMDSLLVIFAPFYLSEITYVISAFNIRIEL